METGARSKTGRESGGGGSGSGRGTDASRARTRDTGRARKGARARGTFSSPSHPPRFPRAWTPPSLPRSRVRVLPGSAPSAAAESRLLPSLSPRPITQRPDPNDSISVAVLLRKRRPALTLQLLVSQQPGEGLPPAPTYTALVQAPASSTPAAGPARAAPAPPEDGRRYRNVSGGRGGVGSGRAGRGPWALGRPRRPVAAPRRESWTPNWTEKP